MPFRVPLQLEAIGDDRRQYLRAVRRGDAPRNPGRELRAMALIGDRRPWVAELTGLDPRTAFTRQVLVPKYDYRRANSAGSRGVTLNYLLDEGKLYEVNALVTWKRQERYYVCVENGVLITITHEEALRWLSARVAKSGSVLTS